MTKAAGLHRQLAAIAVAMLLLCVPALASGASTPKTPPASEAPLFIPGAFRVPASNGYSLYVLAVPQWAGRRASLMIFVTAKGKGARYLAPAAVTATSMQADLGALGRISVTFHPTNQAETVTCGKREIPYDSGQWEGEIRFQGEEGYTSAEASTVPGNLDYVRTELCEVFYSGSDNGPRPGAELFLRNPGLGARLSVSKRRPGAAAQIFASMSEYTSGISIARYASLRMPSRSFTFDRRLRTATLRPPAPFSGSARYDRDKKAGQRWSGDLSVDLPGRSGVALTGQTLRAYLVRAG
ncbi:MAG TPA: hypothetical protein VIT89_09240 [Solirubrobacterales bacterium]